MIFLNLVFSSIAKPLPQGAVNLKNSVFSNTLHGIPIAFVTDQTLAHGFNMSPTSACMYTEVQHVCN
jgi:hypothetical protein